ncbi:MAG: hypothetical protein HUK03_04040 [Bacteroidaceae bacterium]|nr:hypothetical protein [Bacteroidaceae bacterium]
MQDKFAKSKKTHETGYVSFTEEDLQQAKAENVVNDEAYGLLDAAMRTSSHLTEQDRNGDSVLIDDIYPCTAAECDEMDSLLNQAEKAAKDPNDPKLKAGLTELRAIVHWSRAKHWNFKWSLIGGCVLAILGMYWMYGDAKKDAARSNRMIEQIENWAEQDTTIAFEECPAYDLSLEYSTANACKKAKLSYIKHLIADRELDMKTCKSALAYNPDDESKVRYENTIKIDEAQIEEQRARYDEINEMNFSDFKDYVLEQDAATNEHVNSHSSTMYFWLIYVIILIPAYIYSSHQYGYNITRHRTENKVLGGIQKTLFGIASFFLGSGLAMALLPGYEVTTTYSDGSKETHKEDNVGNILILAIKAVMIFIGLLIFAITSVFIMTYVTVMALKRNHDWSKVAAATQQAVSKTTAAIKESGIADKASAAAKNAMDKASDMAKDAKGKIEDKIKKD